MKRICCLILVTVFIASGSIEASFERSWYPVRNQALGNSNFGLISSTKYNSDIYLTIERSTILPADIERTVIAGGKSNQNCQFSFYWDTFGDKEVAPGLSYIEETKAVKASYLLYPSLIVGGQLKSFNLNTAYKGTGYSFDVGFQFQLCSWLKAGLEGRDIYNKISYSTEHSDRIPTQYSLMLEFDIRENLDFFVALNNLNEVNIGCEFTPVPEFSLRAGMHRGDWAGGFAIKKNSWIIEYAVFHDLLGSQQTVSVGRSL